MRLPPHHGKTARKRHEQVKRLLHPFSQEIMDNLDKERPIAGDWKFYENSFGTALQIIVLSFVVYWLVSGSVSRCPRAGVLRKRREMGRSHLPHHRGGNLVVRIGEDPAFTALETRGLNRTPCLP